MNKSLTDEVPWDIGFYFVPGFRKYAINREGVLKNLATNRVIRWSIFKGGGKKNIKGGYRVTNIYSDTGKRKGVSRHRLLALVFLPCPGDPSEYTVNHIDGVPGNDALDNLEWATRSENVKHAYDNGLYPNKTKTVLLRYWKTGEELKFDSIEACAQHLGVSHSTVYSRLSNASGVAYTDGLQLKLDDDTPWIDPGELVRNVRRTVDIAVMEVSTGKITIFSSLNQVAKTLGLSYWYVARCLGRDKPYKGYLIREWSSDLIWPTVD